MNLLDRHKGALLGLAVGDAMGGPLAFLSEEQVRIKLGTVTGMIGGGWLDLRPGEVTELLEMALLLTHSLVEKGKFDRLDVAMRYVDLYERRTLSLDNTTRAALGAIATGTPVDEASLEASALTGEDGSTNAPLVRAIPLALLLTSDDAMLVQAAMAEAAITHESTESRATAAVAALLASRMLRGPSGFDALFDDVEDCVRRCVPDVRGVLGSVRNVQERDLRDSAGAVDTLERSLWYLYWCESFEDALVRSIRRGGPAPVVGAVVGSLAGAFFGVRAIPERWLRALERRREIEDLAERLHDLAGRKSVAS